MLGAGSVGDYARTQLANKRCFVTQLFWKLNPILQVEKKRKEGLFDWKAMLDCSLLFSSRH